MQSEFKGMGFKEVYNTMKENLNITNIQIEGKENISNDFAYTLDDQNWKEIQLKGLSQGYESRSMR